MEDFRKMDGPATPEDLHRKVTVYLFELNLLIRSLGQMGVTVHVDVVDREEGWSQIVIRGPEP
jgi:hypothetical protein